MEGDKIGDGGESLLATAGLHQLLEVVLFVLSVLVWAGCASWGVLLDVVFWLALHLCFLFFCMGGRFVCCDVLCL